MRKEFHDRQEFWRTAPVPDELKGEVARTVAGADKFWQALDGEFLPALQRNDYAAMQAVHDAKLGPLYKQQHHDIVALVDHLNAYRERMAQQDAMQLSLSLGAIGLLAAILLGGLYYAGVLVQRRIVAPLAHTARGMNAMAEGGFDLEIPGAERRDEFGLVAKAMMVFRDAGKKQQATTYEQQAVVGQLSEALVKLASGDLVFRLKQVFAPEYEPLRLAYNDSVARLETLMNNVSTAAASVTNGTTEIQAASDDLARRNEHQAARLEETAAAMNGATHDVEQAAAQMREMRHSIETIHERASGGEGVAGRAVQAMAAIEASSSQINTITGIIDQIAFQTSLLALNAGVEAARAGDAGKGFAVVANEVRALAQRAGDAAQEIKDLIATSASQVEMGSSLVSQTGDAFREIAAQVAELNAASETASSRSEIQAGNLRQVNGAVRDMDQMTQQNAAMVEQSNAAARSLAHEAERLAQLVAQFAVNQQTHGASSPMPAAAPARRLVVAPVTLVASTGAAAVARTAAQEDWAAF